MGLTSPSFLFLFLPLSLPFSFFLPRAWRASFLSLFSVFLYVFANRENTVGLSLIALLLFFTVWLAYLPAPKSIACAKVRTAIGVLVPLSCFLVVRVVSEYTNTLAYPTGLLFFTLGAISFAVDTARGDTVRPRNPLELVGYLLFFPCLLIGPYLRSKEYFDLTEQIGFSSPLFSRGAVVYMVGYVKRMAVFAIITRSLSEALLYLLQNECTLPTLLLLLALSYFGFRFFVTGTADMARGVSLMLGMELPRDRSNLLLATTPDRALLGLLSSLRVWFYDYIQAPISHRWGTKFPKWAFTLLFYSFFVLLLRTRPEMLLFGLPVLLFALLSGTRPVKRLRSLGAWWMPLLNVLSALLCSLFTLALFLDRPLDVFQLFGEALGGTGNQLPDHVFAVMRDERHLLVLLIAAALTYVYMLLRRRLFKKLSERGAVLVICAETVSVFAAFFLSLIYLLPQFPGAF